MESTKLPAVVCLAVGVAASFASGVSAEPLAESAVVRGTVSILRKGLFGGLRESEDRGGAVVYLTGFRQPAPEEIAYLQQSNEQFEPHVLPIVAGQEVSFPNHDRIYHNVFSVSLTEPFDLGQYRSSDPPRSHVFDRPGLVPVFCNIHPQMISYVVVLENDAFAVTGEDGSFVIHGVPPGRVTVNAWMPGGERVSRALELVAGEEVEVDLELRQVQRNAPHKRKDGSEYPKPDYQGG